MDKAAQNEPAVMDVLAIMSSSKYSPASLRHLPRPVPNDLPRSLDGTIFTFEDAFEDLLVVSQGRQLPDIYHNYQQRQLLRSMFPNGEPSWFWMRRLESQNLVKIPPFSSLFQNVQQDWGRLHQDLDRKAAETWRGMSKGYNNVTDQPGDVFEELGRAFKHVERGFTGNNGKEPPIENGEAGKEPDNFDELFSFISSKWPETATSWDAFRKTIQEKELDTPSGAIHREDDRQSNANTETSRDEYVDRFGYLHRSVTRIKRDKDGNEIGREKQITIRPAEPEKRGKEDRALDASNNAEETGKKSWFWK